MVSFLHFRYNGNGRANCGEKRCEVIGPLTESCKYTIHERGISCWARTYVRALYFAPCASARSSNAVFYWLYIFITLQFYGLHLFASQRSHLSRWCTTDVRTSVKEMMAALLSPELARRLSLRGQNHKKALWNTFVFEAVAGMSTFWQEGLQECDAFKICSLAPSLLLERHIACNKSFVETGESKGDATPR